MKLLEELALALSTDAEYIWLDIDEDDTLEDIIRKYSVHE